MFLIFSYTPGTFTSHNFFKSFANSKISELGLYNPLILYDKTNDYMLMNICSFKNKIDLYEWVSHLTGGFSEPYTFGERMAKWAKLNYPYYDVVHDNQTLAYGLLYEVRVKL